MGIDTVNVRMESKRKKILDIFFIIILILYPLRHIANGIDFWDTGYNYANFEYMGLEHMDSMWLFSTYLANVAGHFITKLPFGISLIGMNFYTGLFTSALAAAGYIFCTRKLEIPGWIVFIGEMLAVSLCWCPTALLYNYLTYVLFLACVILLYCGLTGAAGQDEKGTVTGLSKKGNVFLFIAGVCLGANVLVRFSNLPEAALIVAVWAYGIIEWLEKRKKISCKNEPGCVSIGDSGKEESILHHTILRTLICLGGYLTSLFILFSYIHIRYGLDQYVAGIQRLFAMTDSATDYKADSMIMGMVTDYVENLYWVERILVIVAAGMLVFCVAGFLADKSKRKFQSFVLMTARIVCIILAVLMVVWLYYRGFCSVQFFTYGPVRRPAILFLMLSMVAGAVRIFDPRAPKEEKLISGLVILVILLTSIGSNNKTYPSINNLFIAAPYTLWEIYKFIKNFPDIKAPIFRKTGRLLISVYPAKCILAAFLMMFMVQCAGFGMVFVFAEATGAQDMTVKVKNNEILSGVKMNPERARWMTEITEYVDKNGLEGEDVILYGQIPAMSFYLQMPSAFNPWSDLTSYSVGAFEKDLGETADKMKEDSTYRPVIILENEYAECLEGYMEDAGNIRAVSGDEILQNMLKENASNATVREVTAAEKYAILLGFIDEHGYEISFRNEKFAVLEN